MIKDTRGKSEFGIKKLEVGCLIKLELIIKYENNKIPIR